MGVGAMVGATLLAGFTQARSIRQQTKAAEAQAQSQADIMMRNSDQMAENAEAEARTNALNNENKRRQLNRVLGQQKAQSGAAGLTMSGSALQGLAESNFNIEKDLAIDRYNNSQNVTNMYQKSTDYYNQGNIYRQQARDIRKAGKRQMIASALSTAFSLADNLYTANSVASKKAGSLKITGRDIYNPASWGW